MTNQEKIAQGFFTTQLDVVTGETTQIIYTDEQVQECLDSQTQQAPQFTVEQLQAQLADIASKLQALQGAV
jgi:hypothetical protein